LTEYYFGQAHHRSEATDVVPYLAANTKWLGIVKRPRKRSEQKRLALTKPLKP
jgi:hypothetical protein